jgi:hypothetical protein
MVGVNGHGNIVTFVILQVRGARLAFIEFSAPLLPPFPRRILALSPSCFYLRRASRNPSRSLLHLRTLFTFFRLFDSLPPLPPAAPDNAFDIIALLRVSAARSYGQEDEDAPRIRRP